MSSIAGSPARINIFPKIENTFDTDDFILAYCRLRASEVYATHAAEEYAPGYRFIDDARECLGSLSDITSSPFIFAESRYLLGLAELNFSGKMSSKALAHFTESAEAGNGKAAYQLEKYYNEIGDAANGRRWGILVSDAVRPPMESPAASTNSSPVSELSSLNDQGTPANE